MSQAPTVERFSSVRPFSGASRWQQLAWSRSSRPRPPRVLPPSLSRPEPQDGEPQPLPARRPAGAAQRLRRLAEDAPGGFGLAVQTGRPQLLALTPAGAEPQGSAAEQQGRDPGGRNRGGRVWGRAGAG